MILCWIYWLSKLNLFAINMTTTSSVQRQRSTLDQIAPDVLLMKIVLNDKLLRSLVKMAQIRSVS